MKEIHFDDSLFRDFFRLDDPEKERQLFWTCNELDPNYCKNHPLWTFRDAVWRKLFYRKTITGNPWRDRLQLWAKHIDSYFQIKHNHGSERAAALSTERIDKLDGLLTILDNKIGMTLSTSSFLLAGVTFFVSLVPSLTAWIKRPHWFGPTVLVLIYALIFYVVFLCLLAIWFSLRGYRRVVWGDLGLSKRETSDDKEAEYTAFLIISLARRTNMFRAATVVIRKTIFWLFVLAGVAGGLLIARTATELWHGGSKSAPGIANPEPVGSGKFELNHSTIVMAGGSFSISNTEVPLAKPKTSKGEVGKGPKHPKKPDCCLCCGKN